MGERAILQGTRAGQFGLNDFLGQSNNRATPQNIIRTILPVQEMREFQRIYRFDTGSQLLGLGQRISLLRWTVPANEYWKPLQILYQNLDSVVHTVLIAYSMFPGPGALVWQPVRTQVNAVGTKIVYGADADGALAGINSTYLSRIPVTMEPGDTIDLIDLTVAAGAASQSWFFAYELVPKPVTPRSAGVTAVVTVV